MIFELLLLVPFAAAGILGTRSVVTGYVRARRQGVEVPRALFSSSPPGEIRMHDWAQRQIESMDAKREQAIAIGRAELEAGSERAWDNAWHDSLEAAGAERDNMIFGGVVMGVERPTIYSVEGCDCDRCEGVRAVASGKGPKFQRAIDKWFKSA